MRALKLLFILVISLELCSLKKPEKILFQEGKEMSFSIHQKKQQYEITFPEKQKKPENIQISMESENSNNQIVSFSNVDQKCRNGKKYATKKADFFLEKNQIAQKKMYLCIECHKVDACEFKLTMNSGKLGTNLEEEEVSLGANYEDEDEVNLMAGDFTIDLYTLESTYADFVTIPTTYKQAYQVSDASNAKYSVSGSSVKVSTSGYIIPKNTTWYWYGGLGTTSPDPNKTPTSINVDYTLGTSKVTVKTSTQTYVITVNVKDYAETYVEKIVDDFIAKNITSKMTELEKYKAITAFPAQYPYNAKYSSYKGMILCGGGDCWASSSTILYICKKVGIQAHLRYGANSGGAGSGHRNVAALIGGKVYVAEAGMSYTSVPRPYSVNEENVGFYYQTVTGGIKIVQYDGFDEDIAVPSSINGKNVVETGELCFNYGQKYSGVYLKSITLPNTLVKIGKSTFNSLSEITTLSIPANVTSIGEFAFTNCGKLASINVVSSNKYFATRNGVLYNKNFSQLLFYPSGKTGDNYTIATTTTNIAAYSFYYTKYVKNVHVPSKVNYIGEGAFGTSAVQNVYFYGNQPTIIQYAFASLNVKCYYPSTKNWDTSTVNTKNAKSVTWVQWNPTTTLLATITNSSSPNAFLIVASVIAFLAIGGIFALAIKKGKKNSSMIEKVDADFRIEGGLLQQV